MNYVGEDRIRNILNQLGADIRETEIDGRRFTVTFRNGGPVVICEWGKLPHGKTINDSDMWWIRKWEADDGPLPDHLKAAVDQVS